ncbi:MAG: hypothetical protein J5970_03500 [Bacilli bacterium]|nr:hypothetical protein [Bacilli bacterium]
MNEKLKIIIGLLVFFVMPVLSAYIVVRLLLGGKGGILVIIFIGLIVLSVILSIYRIVKYNKRDKED